MSKNKSKITNREVQSAECRVQSAECRVQSAECRVQSKLRLFICVALAVLVGAVGLIVALIVIPANATSEITGHGLINDPYIIYAPEHWGQVVAHQWADANEITYVKLGGDIIANNGSFGSGTGYFRGALHVPPNKRIALDLQTYKIDRGLTEAQSNGMVIFSEGFLTIDGDAQLHEEADAGWNDGYLTTHGVSVTGGMITGGYSDGSGGLLGIDIGSGSSDGTSAVTGGGLVIVAGTVVMNGGAVCNNRMAAGSVTECSPGVTAMGGAKFILNDGLICLNVNNGNSSDGGGISMNGNSILEMHGGDVSWNSTQAGKAYACWGGGISAWSAESVIDGGKIRHNAQQGSGSAGGLALEGVLSLSNVEISDNITSTSGSAIGVHSTDGSATLSLNNVVITGNICNGSYTTSSRESAVINLRGALQCSLSGKIVLQNNWGSNGDKVSFYLGESDRLSIAGEITDDSDIYIEMAEADVFTSGFAQNSPNTNPEVFSSNLQGLVVATTANGQELEIRASNGNADDWNAIVKRSMNEHSATNFTVANGWTATNGSFGNGRGFGSQPYEVAGTGYDNLRIPASANVNLTIPAGQVLSRNLTTAKDDGYVIKVYGTLSVNGGGTIRGGNNTGNGGAIYVADGGRLTLSNINLTGNQASRGGAVYVAAGGTLILDSAVINGNTALLDGGGIYVEAGATVYVQNSTAVMNNLSRNNVDNLFLANKAKLVIYSNLTAGSASSYIGVTLENGVGSFASATSVTDLSRLVADNDFYTIIAADKVPTVVTKESQTNAYQWNTAIELSQTKNSSVRFDLLSDWLAEDGKLGTGVGFTASGALYVPANATIILHLTNGVKIDRGLLTAIADGGVIVVDGTLSIGGDGTITGGNSTANGGGILVNGTLSLEDGVVTGNHADNGGGIYVATDGTLNLQGGTITQNTANIGSGIYAGGKFTLQGGAITDNVATTGAGVYVAGSGIDNVQGLVTIADNVDKDGNRSNLVFDGDTQTINFTGTMNNGSQIFVTPRDTAPVLTSNFAQAQIAPTELFGCDNNEYAIFNENGEVRTMLATDLQVKKPQSVVLTYTGKEQVAITDFAFGDLTYTELPTGLSIDEENQTISVTKVGTYTFTVTPVDSYIWEIVDGVGGGNAAVTVTIEVKPMVADTIIWRVDGEEVDRVEYTGAEHLITAWLPTADGETEITDYLIGDLTATTAGEYTVAINPDATDSIDFSNAVLTFSWRIYKTEATVHYQIDGKDITITEYTGEIQQVTAYLITANNQRIDNVAITRETAATAIDNYQAELTSSVLANFTITNDIVFKWSIVAKELDLQWVLDGDTDLPENNQVIYDGNEHRVELMLNGVADGEKVTAILSDDSGTDVGEHVTRIVGLSGLHASNYTYDVFAAFTWSIVPLNDVVIDVNWTWSRDQYYVGETLTADVLAGTTATAEGFGELAGTVVLLTADGKLTLTEPNQTVEVKFTPSEAAFVPVRATLTVPSKYIEVTFAANDGTVGQVTRQYSYNDAVVFVDKLTREHYTHVGWSTTPLAAVTAAELATMNLVQLDGNILATADVTYYAVWCYATYTIRFHTNNPLQYTTLSHADGVEQVMTWTATTGFTQANHGTVIYDAETNCYVYEYNHADWQAKSTGDLWFTSIQWNANAGFAFAYWADTNGERCDKISNMQNLDLYAQWRGRDYTVRFVDGEATVVGTGTVTNGATLADAPTLASRTDANFAGWFIDATAASDPDNNGGQRVILGETLVWTQGELTLYAGWTQKQVVVEFPKVTGLNITILAHSDDTDKALTNGDYLDVGTTLTIKVEAEDGYRYTGLQITVLGETENYGADATVITYNIAGYDSAERRIPLLISGMAEVLTYKIIYDNSDDWAFVENYTAPTAYDLANNVILPSADKVTRLGYTFAGWATAVGGSTITNTQGQLGDLTLYPQWTADAQTIVLYKGGQEVQTVTSATGAEYALPDWSNEAGFDNFTFQGWSETADLSTPRTGTYLVKAGVNNLYAVWAIKTGTLTLNVTEQNNATYNFGETVVTLTANSTQDYSDTQHGLVLNYIFTNTNTGNVITNADGKLALSQVAESGNYYCELTITAPDYAAAVTVTSAEQTIAVKARGLSNVEYANMVAVTYTGNPQTPALPRVTLDGVPLSAGIDFTYEYSQNITVGTAHLVITGRGNFTGTADKAAFTIEAAELSVLVNRYTGVYDGESHNAIASQEAASVDGSAVVWTYQAEGAADFSETMPAYINASTYTVYYRVECANHKTVTGSIEVQIDKYQTAVVWGTTTFEYDGRPQQPTATAAGIGDETISISLNGDNNPTNAGDYSVTASTSNQNYRLTNATTNFTITPRKTTVTITPNGLQRVGEEIKYAEAVVDNPAPNHTPTITFTYYKRIDGSPDEELFDHAKPTEAGTYLVVVTIEDTNYELTGLDNAPFIILGEDATITNEITVNIVDWVYGDTSSELVFHAVTGEDDAQITYYHVANDGTETEIAFSDIRNVGTYRVYIFIPAVEWNDTTNYGRTAADASVDFRVLPRALTLTWSNTTYIYDGTQHTPTVTLNNVLDNDVCNVTVQLADGAGVTVGKYTVTVMSPTNANYVLSNITTHEFTITARPVKVAIVDQTSEYGAALVTLVGETADNAICGDDNADGSVYTLNKETGLNVGTYRITGSSTNANYAVTFVNAAETRNYGQYTITAQVVDVVWVLADNYTYTGTEQNVLAHVVDKYSEQVIELEVTANHNDTHATVFKSAGDYQLTARDTTRNYNLTEPTTTVTIDRALLTITADDLTVRYGEAFTLSATVTGFVNGEDTNVLQGGQIVTDYQLNDDIGVENTYPIKASGYDSDNYVIEYVAGTLTVEGIYLRVQINDQTSVYGNSILPASYTFLGDSILNPSQVFVIEKEAGLDVGEYKLTGRILNRNYGVEFVTEHDRDYGIYTITPRAITVEINDQHSVIGEDLAELTANVAYDAIIGLDNADGSVYTLTKEDGDTAGEYRIVGTTANANYAVTFIAANAERDYGIYLMLPPTTLINVYNGQEQTAFTVRTISDTTVYTWLFSTDGENFIAEQPCYQKPGEYTTHYRVVVGDSEYTGTIQWQIAKATLTVVIGENTVVKGQAAALDAFTVTGLGTGDDKLAVIAIVYTDGEYDAENAAVGDTFALGAVLREEYADCYELVLVEPNTLTVVAAKTNLGLIIGIVVGAVVVVAGATAAAVIVVIKKKKSGGKSTKSGNQSQAGANELPLNRKAKN